MEYSSTLVGVGISILANSTVALGLNVLKLAHIRLQLDQSLPSHLQSPRNNEQHPLLSPSTPNGKKRSTSTLPTTTRKNGRKPPRLDKAFLRSSIWWCGQSFMLLGEFGNFLAYAFAPASLVAPLGSTALLANAFISPLLLREPFRQSDLLGILFVALGSLTVIYSSPTKEVVLSPDEVERAVRTLSFGIYCAFCLGGIGGLGWASRTRWADEFVLIDVGLSAIAGGFTVLSTKAFSSFINRLFLKAFRHWITYPILFILILSALVQVNFINKALQRFDSRVVVPTQFLTFTLSAIIGSAILYREFDNVPTDTFINFIFGLALSAGGVAMLTREMVVMEMEDEGIVNGLFGEHGEGVGDRERERERMGGGVGRRRSSESLRTPRRERLALDGPATAYPTTSSIFLSPSSPTTPLPLSPSSHSHSHSPSSDPSTITPSKLTSPKNINSTKPSSPESRRLRHLRSLPSIRNTPSGPSSSGGGGGGGGGRARTVSSVTLGGPIYLFAGVSPGTARTWGGGIGRRAAEAEDEDEEEAEVDNEDEDDQAERGTRGG